MIHCLSLMLSGLKSTPENKLFPLPLAMLRYTTVSYNELLATKGELSAALANRQGELLGSDPVVVPTGTQRGDGKTSDTYFILGMTISYNFFDNGLAGSRNRLRRGKRGCRTN